MNQAFDRIIDTAFLAQICLGKNCQFLILKRSRHLVFDCNSAGPRNQRLDAGEATKGQDARHFAGKDNCENASKKTDSDRIEARRSRRIRKGKKAVVKGTSKGGRIYAIQWHSCIFKLERSRQNCKSSRANRIQRPSCAK